ncbi:DUF1896 family protein [Mucilaginibacter sp. UYCu711]|uniref:DUF1896 family protein n=1 Tax=Mucilaginibacter sp. UYCu711 TaxID=3156339 RepID=UPI003D1BE777
MKTQLISHLHSYMLNHQTDLLIALQEDHRLDHYLETKVDSVKELISQLEGENRPAYVIEALCLEELTRDLRPSRFSYLRDLLEEEFEADFRAFSQSGILTYELINLVGGCEPIFEVFAFGETNEDSHELKHALMGMIAEYFER